MNTSGRAFLKNTQVIKNPNRASKPTLVKAIVREAPTIHQQVVKEVNRQLKKKSELKFYDQYINASVPVSFTSGYTQVLSNIPQGVGDSQRIGDTAMPTSLELKFNTVAANADIWNTWRVLVIRWKANDSAYSVAASKIFQNTGSVATPLSAFNHDNRSQFEVLYDSGSFITNGLSTLPTSNYAVSRNVRLKLAKKPIQFVTGTTVQETNSLYLVAITDDNPASLNHPQLTWYYRLNYTDS